MNRPIKYKVWDKTKKVLSKVASIHFGDDGAALTIVIEPAPKTEYVNFLVQGENAILLQFTGQIDKNGKEIYEGDRLNLYVESAKKYENAIVVYSERHCCFCVEKYGSQFNFTDYKIENIGNVFENL